MAAGNKHLGFKETLNDLELRSPGTKHDLYFGFLDRAVDRFVETGDDDTPVALGVCADCGAPAAGEVCAFCRLASRARGGEGRSGVEPVLVGPPRRKR